MKDLKMEEFFPPTVWPPHNALRQLAIRVKVMKKEVDDKSWNPFLAAELKR